MGRTMSISRSDALAAAIDAMPLPTAINGVVPLTFLHTERGNMRSKKALGNDFAGWVKLAGLYRPKQNEQECRLTPSQIISLIQWWGR